MKTSSYLTLLGSGIIALSSSAEILTFELSPPGTSPKVGLSPANEIPAVTNSEGGGGAILTGITYDTDTMTLDYAIGYGMLGGFPNLTGPVNGAHIHGPAPVTGTAGVVVNFDTLGQRLPAGDPSKGGIIVGSVVLDQLQDSDLRAGLWYVNLHTAANPTGEIRGQLVEMDNTPPSVVCPTPTTAECTSPDGAVVKVTATVSDTDGDPLSVTWLVNGDEFAKEEVPSGGDQTNAEVSIEGLFGLGLHNIEVIVSDGIADPVSCTTTVTVEDTTPPVIERIKPSKWALWPPNHKFKTIKLDVRAEDACGEVTASVLNVESNEPENGTGDGNTEPDWEITGDLELELRSERAGGGDGRVYTITVEVVDEAGNSTTGTTEVWVPKSKKQYKKLAKGPRN